MLDEYLVIHPGETLREMMYERDISVRDAAAETGLAESKVEGILNGTERIGDEEASAFEEMLGPPSVFWLRLQRRFDCESALYALSSADSLDVLYEALSGSSGLVDKLLKVRYEVQYCLDHLKKAMDCAEDARSLPGGEKAAAYIRADCTSYAERLCDDFSAALEASLHHNQDRDWISSDLKEAAAYGVCLETTSCFAADDLKLAVSRGDDSI